MVGLERGILMVGGFLSTWAAYSLGKRTRSRAKHEKVFVLAVTLKFSTVQDREEFLAIWTPLSMHVRRNEPETLGFEFLIADTEPTKVLVYERYISKEAFLTVHRTSKPFLEFKQAQKDLPFEVQVSGQSYFETNHGFM